MYTVSSYNRITTESTNFADSPFFYWNSRDKRFYYSWRCVLLYREWQIKSHNISDGENALGKFNGNSVVLFTCYGMESVYVTGSTEWTGMEWSAQVQRFMWHLIRMSEREGERDGDGERIWLGGWKFPFIDWNTDLFPSMRKNICSNFYSSILRRKISTNEISWKRGYSIRLSIIFPNSRSNFIGRHSKYPNSNWSK